MKKILAGVFFVLILMVIAYGFGRSHAPEPPDPVVVEVIKYVDRIVEVKTSSTGKKSAVSKSVSKHTSSDGSVTETTTTVSEVEDKQLDSFVSEKLKQSEEIKVVNTFYNGGYGLTTGIDRDRNLVTDIEYQHKIFENEEKTMALFAKGEIGFQSDLNGSNTQAVSAKVGVVLLN